MDETFKEVIIWCFTSGTISAVVTWFIGRKQNRAKASKEVESIYKEMLDDVKDTLNKLSKDYNELYDMQLATQKAVAQSGVCTHIAICPVRHELRRQKQVVQEYNRKEQTDVETTLIKTTKPITVPQSSVELILSLENLRNLPPGASYHDKSGQANLNVVSDGGNLIITSSCDSLQLVIEQWEFRYNKLLREYEELQKRR